MKKVGAFSQNNNFILFVKFFKEQEEFIQVAVKINLSGKCFVKTLHLLSTCNAERYIEKGTLKSLTTAENTV